MSYALYILLISIFLSAQGLRCRMEQDSETEEEFENIVRNCLRQENDPQQKDNHHNIKRNENNRKGYIGNDQQGKINSSGGKRRQEDNYDKDEEEYDYNEYDSGNTNNRDKQMQTDQHDLKFHGYQNQGTKQSGTRRNQGSRNYSRNIGSPLESIEPCIIHCIFKQKKMLNKDNYIDKTNAIRVLTQKIRNPELKEFVEDSVNECFDIIDNENSQGKCEDSKNFALCLEGKGKNNCEDWDRNSNHRRGNNNRHSYNNNNYNRPGGSQLNKGEKGNNRHSFNTNNGEGNNGDHYTRNERERSKTKHDNTDDRGNNNYRDKNPDNDDQKIKLSDYFQTRG